jgi:hypothetical protein
MQKPLKRRELIACGLMQMPSNTLYYRFERKLLSKLAPLAKVAVISTEEDLQIEFQVPRHVPNYVHLDDENAYKVMVAAAIKCKDPKINLAVVRPQVRSRSSSNHPVSNGLCLGERWQSLGRRGRQEEEKKGHKEVQGEPRI